MFVDAIIKTEELIKFDKLYPGCSVALIEYKGDLIRQYTAARMIQSNMQLAYDIMKLEDLPDLSETQIKEFVNNFEKPNDRSN